MLLKKSELVAIKAGHVSLVFRRWQRPSVKTGGTLKTAIGVLAIDEVKEITSAAITARDAKSAGYRSKQELLALLDEREGTIYRIKVSYAGADPRIKLRENDKLTAEEFAELSKKLERLDNAAKVGPWTRRILETVQANPHVSAGDLAAKLGLDKEWLKLNVRKLKNLGLTISHEPGYELSPRGRVVLNRMKSVK
jgi:hypothetical protein